MRAVAMMDRVARQTESYYRYSASTLKPTNVVLRSRIVPFGDAIADAAAQLVKNTHASAILVISNRGMTAATISAARPEAPVVAISDEPRICRRMSLMWGVVPHWDKFLSKEKPTAVARRVARELKLAAAGEFIVLVRGFHSEPELNTPTLSLVVV